MKKSKYSINGEIVNAFSALEAFIIYNFHNIREGIDILSEAEIKDEYGNIHNVLLTKTISQ